MAQNAQPQQAQQHVLLVFQRRSGGIQRIESGRFQRGEQQGGFGVVQGAGGLAQVGLCRTIHTVCQVTETGTVEEPFQQLCPFVSSYHLVSQQAQAQCVAQPGRFVV